MEGYYIAASLSIIAFALLTNYWSCLIKNTLEWGIAVSIIKSVIFSDIKLFITPAEIMRLIDLLAFD